MAVTVDVVVVRRGAVVGGVDVDGGVNVVVVKFGSFLSHGGGWEP